MAESESAGKYTCAACGDTFTEIGRHYAANPDHRPTISDAEMDMLRGLLMGDATLTTTDSYPIVTIGVVEKRYLRDLQQSYPHIFNSIRHQPRGGNHQDFYLMSTVPHPQFYEFKNWYSSGEKVFPTDLDITPTVLKHWYCTDGGLAWTSTYDYAASARITCESQELERIVEYFDDTPFDPSVQGSKTIYFSRQETPTVLGWMGPPPDGFTYKWEWQDKDRYTRKKQTTPVTPEHLSGLSEQLVNVARRLETLESKQQQQDRIKEYEDRIEEKYQDKLQKKLDKKETELKKEARQDMESEKRDLRNRLIRDVYDELSDLDEQQLKTVNRFGGISQTMLADAVGLSQQSISIITD